MPSRSRTSNLSDEAEEPHNLLVWKSMKPKPLRNADFPAPRKINESDFKHLCKISEIQPSDHKITKKWLDELVTDFDVWMKGERLQLDRASDRDRLKTALSNTEKAAKRIRNLGPSGRRATRVISASVAPMLAARWLNEKFPDDDLTPQRSKLPSAQGSRTSTRTPQRAPEYFIEEKSLEARMHFVRQRSVETTIAALNEIIGGLERSIRSLALQPGSRGGRKPTMFRHFLIINLAEIWSRLGRTVVVTPTSEFADFCEVVADSIGWPTDGMDSAIPDAVRHWRNLPRKTHR